MYSYTLDSSSPNQNFSTVVDGFRFDITLNTAFDMLFATVDINGVRVKTTCRCINGQFIVPYAAYLPEGCGNFLFYTKDDNYPSYKNFNNTCFLVYLSADEIKEARSGT